MERLTHINENGLIYVDAAYEELQRRCEAAGLPPKLDRETVRRLHRER